MKTEEFARSVEFYAERLHYRYNHGPGTGLKGLLEPRWIEMPPNIRDQWRHQARALFFESEVFIKKDIR